MESPLPTNFVSLFECGASGGQQEYFVRVTEKGVGKNLGPFNREEQHRVAQNESVRLGLPNRMFAPIK